MFFFRGTPLLVQIFLIYYGSGQFVSELRSLGLWQFFREPYFCAVLTLTLNTAAYTAEILRGAIRAVPFGEVEAGRAFGMSCGLILRRVILPKAFRIALPAYTNEVIFLFQATSLVSIITIMDLTGVGRVIIAETFRTFEVWIFVGLCYLAMSYGILYAVQAPGIPPVRSSAGRPRGGGCPRRGSARRALRAAARSRHPRLFCHGTTEASQERAGSGAMLAQPSRSGRA